MKELEERDLDRTGWPSGEWDSEPDKVQWRDAATGFPCLIVRAETTGALCGYVGVPPGHPCYEKGYDDCRDRDGDALDCHGGLTYSDHCDGHICHVVEDGEEDRVWWLGFDAAHCFDVRPAHVALMARLGHPRLDFESSKLERYRPIAYVRQEVEALARQLKGLEGQ